MSDLLRQLEDDQAILLMYQAGELSDADRAQVESRLASDAGLRMELAELTSLHDDVSAAFSSIDAIREPARCEAAVRAVSRAIVAAKLQPMPTPADKGVSRWRIAWWAYPIAAAALLAVAVILHSRSGPTAITPDEPQNVQVAIAKPPLDILRPVADRDALSVLASNVNSLDSLKKFEPTFPSVDDDATDGDR